MSLPLQLDPWTLRWLADFDERESHRCEGEAHGCDGRAAGEPQFDWPGHARAYRGRAIDHRRRARWLRGLATRVERRRATGATR